MIPEFGVFALISALCVATAQAVFPLVGAHRGNRNWMAVAGPAAAGQFVFVGLAMACLAYSFAIDDFTVRYVAENSNSNLPLQYKLTAVWGGHEGSILLWAFVLTVWTLAVSVFSRSLPELLRARTLGVLGLISVGFLVFILATSNPFARLFPAPVNGMALNPLLQDPAMVAHPPMLYLGYVGLAVVFSLAIAALLGGRLDSAWARWSRPWTLVAWMFLTIGILLGSFWAYYELGWGGWWFWDPVENASFMPWLVATALIHSLAVTEKRGAFKAWTVLLAIIAFSLSLLGTFLVRSGVLTSVHAFAVDPARGAYILGFLAIVLLGSLGLYAWRAPTLRNTGSFALLSRETLLLVNNVLLVVACASVLLGTLYPLALSALGLGKVSVGPPYFNTVFVPVMLMLAFVLGLGPLSRWRRMPPLELMRRARISLVLSLLVVALGVAYYAGGRSLGLIVAVFMALWVALSAVQAMASRVRIHGGFKGWRAIPRGFYGMTLAHLGMAVFIAGAAVVSTFGAADTVRLAPGEAATVAGYRFVFQDIQRYQGSNFNASRGYFTVFSDGEFVTDLFPEKRRYPVRQTTLTEAAIDGGMFRDLFVALGQPLEGDAWSVRIQHKPLVRWIWAGALMMALGGALAASDGRYRAAAKQARASASVTVAGVPA